MHLTRIILSAIYSLRKTKRIYNFIYYQQAAYAFLNSDRLTIKHFRKTLKELTNFLLKTLVAKKNKKMYVRFYFRPKWDKMQLYVNEIR